MILADWHFLHIPILDAPMLAFFLGFVVLFVAFKVAIWLIKAIPFV